MPKKPPRPHRQAAFDHTHVLRLFKQAGKPLTVKELLAGLGAAALHKAKLMHILDTLTRSGRILRLKGAWGLGESMRLVNGTLEIQRSGVGFVICEDKRRKDIFINPRDFGDAWHGDRVAVAITRQRGQNAEGRVARVLSRQADTLPCRVERRIRQGIFLCRPTDPRHAHALLLETSPGQEPPAPGEILTLAPGGRLDHQLYAASLVEALGPETGVDVQERLVKANHGVPGPFPQECLDEAAALPGLPSEAGFQGRADLRQADFVTIDGDTARDFDDAILVSRQGPGYLLQVAIADVSHYALPGSALDAQAMTRGNSYYFPRSVEPMLPEALSNGLCSLNPGVPRLAVVAAMAMSAQGLPAQTSFSLAVIQSKARLTYSQVGRALLEGDEKERQAIRPVLPMLETALELARAMKQRRTERGSLDFDLPEPEFTFTPQGEIAAITPRERHFGHQLIEEFMVAANEAVARFLTGHGVPLPYRIHPEPDPDKLQTLFDVLKRTGIMPKLPGKPTPQGLQAIVAGARGTEMEFLVSRLMLRAMMQAKYHIHNQGHFGLASECYCHFTSPIRRYADLMVHRALKAVLAGQDPPLAARRMQQICEAISACERTAMEAEREIHKRITVLFLQDKVGQEFDATIASLSDFGFWVELRGVMAEGLVRLSSLSDDYYALFPERQELLGQHTGRRFRLGQPIRVRLAGVNLGRLEIDLEPATDTAVGLSRKQQRKAQGKKYGKKNR